MRSLLLLGALGVLTAGQALAEVKSATPAGFELVQTVTVHAPPKAAFAALSNPARWWNGEHSFSGDARNYTLNLKPGGCFCEKLPNGGWAKHLAQELPHLAHLVPRVPQLAIRYLQQQHSLGTARQQAQLVGEVTREYRRTRTLLWACTVCGAVLGALAILLMY